MTFKPRICAIVLLLTCSQTFANEFLDQSAAQLAAKIYLKQFKSTDLRPDGEPYLMYAIRHDRLDLAQVLLCNKVDVNQTDAVQNTALHLAVERDRLDSVDVLERHGANLWALNAAKKTPLKLAVEGEKFEIASTLIFAMIQRVVGPEKARDFFKLLQKEMPLLGKLELMERPPKSHGYSRAGVALNLVPQVFENDDVVLDSVRFVSPSELQAVIASFKKTIGTNHTNSYAETPLHLFAVANRPQNAHLVIQSGAKLYLKDIGKMSAVERALEHDSIETAQVILLHMVQHLLTGSTRFDKDEDIQQLGEALPAILKN